MVYPLDKLVVLSALTRWSHESLRSVSVCQTAVWVSAEDHIVLSRVHVDLKGILRMNWNRVTVSAGKNLPLVTGSA